MACDTDRLDRIVALLSEALSLARACANDEDRTTRRDVGTAAAHLECDLHNLRRDDTAARMSDYAEFRIVNGRLVTNTSVPAEHEPEPVRAQDVLTDEELRRKR